LKYLGPDPGFMPVFKSRYPQFQQEVPICLNLCRAKSSTALAVHSSAGLRFPLWCACVSFTHTSPVQI